MMSKHLSNISPPKQDFHRINVVISYFTGKPLSDIFFSVNLESLEELSPFASEFLVHAADVEVCVFLSSFAIHSMQILN